MEECIGIAIVCTFLSISNVSSFFYFIFLTPLLLKLLFHSQQHKSYEGGIRVHWKGNPSIILGKCTKYDCNGEDLVMSETKVRNLSLLDFELF